jgi:O-antigen ligase/polysaccharide polymerase Wzy-like membrane protein
VAEGFAAPRVRRRRLHGSLPLFVSIAFFGAAAEVILVRPVGAAAIVAVIGLVSLVTVGPFIAWRQAVLWLVLVIMFIPIRRYGFPGNLPFQLEPYRLLAILILGIWIVGLLVDSRVRTKLTGFRGPLSVILIGTLASVAANPGRAELYKSNVIKSTMFLVSFVLILLLVVSVVNSWGDLNYLIRALCWSGAILAVFAVIEYRSGFSPFAHLHKVFPFLQQQAITIDDKRGGHARPIGSSEHPIALGALFVILAPLTIYLAQKESKKWWIATGLMLLAAMASVSRTAVVMIIAVLLVFIWRRPIQTWRFLPYLLPVVIALKVVTPGAIGTLRYYFFPAHGIVASQQTSKGSIQSGGRLTDVGPTFAQIGAEPLFGVGYGTRIRTGPEANGRILDDQWLGTLLDTGGVGTFGWIWLFGRFLHRTGRAARRDPTEDGWLYVCLNASMLGFVAGMFFFDAFSFIQVTIIMFILLGVGSVALRLTRESDDSSAVIPLGIY